MTSASLAASPVSAVIPTFNGRHLLQRHLPHVLLTLRDQDEVVIVDDASTDDTLAWLKLAYSLKQYDPPQIAETFPKFYFPNMLSLSFGVHLGKAQLEHGWVRIIVISLPENMRFAAAANIGVALSSYPLILLLNNDVSPRVDTLAHLLPHFNQPDVFGVGCLEYAVDHLEDELITKPLSSMQFSASEASGKNELRFERGMFIHRRAPEQVTGQTAWVSGGSGLFNRSTWIALGGFDQRFYPAYWEDIDLSYRAMQMGLAVLFEDRAVVFHQHEKTNSTVFGQRTIDKISWKNAATFIAKNGSVWQKLQYLLWQPYWMWKRASHAR